MNINTKVIEALYLGEPLLNNWKAHYSKSKVSLPKFLILDRISTNDKREIALRLLRDNNDLETLQLFALDCAFAAYAYTHNPNRSDPVDPYATSMDEVYALGATLAKASDAAAENASSYASYAASTSNMADAYTYALYSANAAAATATITNQSFAAGKYERERQVDALAYLVSNRSVK